NEKSELEKQLMEMARQKEIPIHFAKSGESWESADTRFFVLSPEGFEDTERNDGSIVIYAKIGGLRWLFTGDLEENGEVKLIKQYPELRIDVLKVGHHGSKTSSSEEF